MEVDLNADEALEIAKRTLALTEENNKILRGMQSAARWSQFFTVIWWIIIIAASYWGYLYLQPYIQKAQAVYDQIGQSGQQAQDYSQQISNFLNQFGKKP
jgi:hypothetical protein